MADIPYVDWDGLVYYDGKVKQFIAEELELCLRVGGFTSFKNLPDPSRDNVNFLYKITEEFTSNSDFKIQDKTYPANTWVQCTDFGNVFLYSIFNESTNIDSALSDYYTKEEVETALREKADKVDLENKADDQPFVNDLFVTTPVGGFKFGESVKGLTVVELFTKLLNLKPTAIPDNNVTQLISEALPMFTGTTEGGVSEVPFVTLPYSSSAYNESGASLSGLYTNDTYTLAGYQVELPAGEDGDPFLVYLPNSITVINLYQWSDLANAWVLTNMEYFNKTTTKKVTVKGTEILYDMYEWDEENYGGSIYMPSNWRFEIEVN